MYFLSNTQRNSINELPHYKGVIFHLNVYLKAITTIDDICLRSLFFGVASAVFNLPKIK